METEREDFSRSADTRQQAVNAETQPNWISAEHLPNLTESLISTFKVTDTDRAMCTVNNVYGRESSGEGASISAYHGNGYGIGDSKSPEQINQELEQIMFGPLGIFLGMYMAATTKEIEILSTAITATDQLDHYFFPNQSDSKNKEKP
jgi:hypothetical protein